MFEEIDVYKRQVEYSVMTWIGMVGVKKGVTNVLKKKCFAEKFIIIRVNRIVVQEIIRQMERKK